MFWSRISGVFGWDFTLVAPNVFDTCVRQLNSMFVYIYLISFLYEIEDVPQKKKFSTLSPLKTIIGVPGKVVHLHYTTVYCACLIAFRFC